MTIKHTNNVLLLFIIKHLLLTGPPEPLHQCSHEYMILKCFQKSLKLVYLVQIRTFFSTHVDTYKRVNLLCFIYYSNSRHSSVRVVCWKFWNSARKCDFRAQNFIHNSWDTVYLAKRKYRVGKRFPEFSVFANAIGCKIPEYKCVLF